MARSFVLPAALFGSLLAHALVLVLAVLSGLVKPSVARTALRDAWVADSVEVGTVPDPSPVRAPAALAPSPAAVEPAPLATPRAVAPKSEPRVAEPDAEEPSERASGRTAASATPAAPSAAAPSVAAPGAASASASVASAAPAARDEPAGSFGALGLPVGVRHLGRAFAVALSRYTTNPAWKELPLGRVGEIEVEIEVDADGRVGRVTFGDDPPPPRALKDMVERALVLLRSGTFSTDPGAMSAGVERLSIEVTLSERPVRVPEGYDPAHFHGQGAEPPGPGRPGYARFTLNSGRHFEAILRFTPP